MLLVCTTSLQRSCFLSLIHPSAVSLNMTLSSHFHPHLGQPPVLLLWENAKGLNVMWQNQLRETGIYTDGVIISLEKQMHKTKPTTFLTRLGYDKNKNHCIKHGLGHTRVTTKHYTANCNLCMHYKWLIIAYARHSTCRYSWANQKG